MLDANTKMATSESGPTHEIETLQRAYDGRARAVVDCGRRDLFEPMRWPRREEYREPLLGQLELARRALDGTHCAHPEERTRLGEALRTVLGAELCALSAPTRAAMRERDAEREERVARQEGAERDGPEPGPAQAAAAAEAEYAAARRKGARSGEGPITIGHLDEVGTLDVDGAKLPGGRTVVVVRPCAKQRGFRPQGRLQMVAP